MNEVLYTALEMIRRATILLYPVIPSSCEKIFNILNLDLNNINFNNYESSILSSHKINDPSPIFPRLND